MAAAERYGGKNDIMSLLPDTVLLLLAAPSTPDEVREEASAYRMMRVAENLGAEFVTVTNLNARALYALAAPSTPQAVRDAPPLGKSRSCTHTPTTVIRKASAQKCTAPSQG